MMHTRILSALLLLCSVSSYGANWYVDADATGTGSGASWANAWTGMDHIVWGGAKVVAGDTVYVSGGSTSKTYTDSWVIDASGTAVNPITIRVGQDSGHDGYVLFDKSASNNTCGGYFCYVGGNYINFDGSVNGTAKMLFQNMVNTNDASTSVAIYQNGSDVVGNISSVVFTNVNNAVQMTYVTGSSIHNCDFTVRGDHGIMITHVGDDWDQVLIYSNRFTIWVETEVGNPASGGADAIQANSGCSIFANRFEGVDYDRNTIGQHPDFVQALTSYRLKFYGNYVLNPGDSGIDLECLNGADGMSDVRVYNNVFELHTSLIAGTEFIRSYAVDNQPLRYRNYYIVNNLFVANTNENTCLVLINPDFANAGNSGTNNWIANNIWLDVSVYEYNTMFGIQGTASNPSVWNITNNVYHPMTGKAGSMQYRNVLYTAAEWLASFDTAGQTNAPSFVNYLPGQDGSNFRLTADDTVARAKGISFSDIFTTDFDGTVRGATWDIGPFAFTSYPKAKLQSGTLRGGTVR